MVSEDDDDDLFSNCEKEFGDELIMEWARVRLSIFINIFYVYTTFSFYVSDILNSI